MKDLEEFMKKKKKRLYVKEVKKKLWKKNI